VEEKEKTSRDEYEEFSTGGLVHYDSEELASFSSDESRILSSAGEGGV